MLCNSSGGVTRTRRGAVDEARLKQLLAQALRLGHEGGADQQQVLL